LRYRRGGLARLFDIMARNLENRASFSGRISPVRVHVMLGGSHLYSQAVQSFQLSGSSERNELNRE